MTPNMMQSEAGRLRKLYAEAEEKMIAYMAEQLKSGVNDYGWGEKKLAEIRTVNAEFARRVAELRKKSKTETDALIKDAYDAGALDYRSDLSAPGERILTVTPESRNNATLRLIRETDDKFDAQASAILRDVEDAYRSIIGEVLQMQSVGVTTTTQSIQSALNEFAERGIVSFIDRAGRKWEMDSYAEMAVRSGMMNAAVTGYTDDALANGERLVIVSDHVDECPLCAKWERTVLALNDDARNDPGCSGYTLEEAIAEGLFHPNCEHSVTVYIHGLTRTDFSKSAFGRTRAEDAAGYAATQKQRKMERNLRKWKRRQAAAITPEDERLAAAYVTRWRSALESFTDENNLKRKRWREGKNVKLSEAALKLPVVRLKPLNY